MTKVAYISTYVPRKCGIATYTFHLRQSVNAAKQWRGKDPVIVLTDEDRDSDDLLLWPLQRDSEKDYVRIARKINTSDVDVVSLQHEFGIFGGEAGQYLLGLIDHLKKPLVTTFHTVFKQPKPPYADIQRNIAQRSNRIIVMNRKGREYLHHSFDIPEEKIVFIPHGTPEPNVTNRKQYREQLGWKDRKVLMTFGLLSRGKGIELILQVLPDLVKQVPNVLYAIVGQTHPQVKKREGEKYRQQLQELIQANGIANNVVMIDRYMEENDLVRHLMACDIYVTPYPGLEQITSGTLAYAVGLGRPVLSTPYCYAQDLLGNDSPLLIPYQETDTWKEQLVHLLSDEEKLEHWSRKMAQIGKSMYWTNVGKQHLQLFSEVSPLGYTVSTI